jgi:hypothetical protein
MEVNVGVGGEFCPDELDDVFDEHADIPKIVIEINPISRQ